MKGHSDSTTTEWPTTDDLAELTAGQWQPTPIRQFVLKVHSRCNLACDYCYVYQLADQSWRDQPRQMSRDTIAAAATRIAEHASRHRLPSVGVVLHGGEPLLAGARFFADTARILRSQLEPATAVRLTVQSNGTLITEQLLDVLAEHEIFLAVSVDGGPDAHDQHRRYPSGRGSYTDVANGLALLSHDGYRRLFSGLLCTVELTHDPVTTYESLLGFGPPRMDFLLPHGNWSARPPGFPADPTGNGTNTPYADWLAAVFDRWYSVPEQETELRMFREIIHVMLGGTSHVDGIGLAPSSVAVIETDGSLEQVDTLKSAYHGAAATGLHIDHNSIDEMLRHPSIVARQCGLAALCEQCRACPIHRICGG